MDDNEIERSLNVGRRIKPFAKGMADAEVVGGMPGPSEMELSGNRTYDALEELTGSDGEQADAATDDAADIAMDEVRIAAHRRAIACAYGLDEITFDPVPHSESLLSVAVWDAVDTAVGDGGGH